jgi:phosphopantothenoylcysteine decarboxylase/phosphopantothenate--cysteine ligase
VSSGVFGADSNTVTLVAARGTERWDKVSKAEVAQRLAAKIAEALK